ncbi:Transcription factor AIG1 [Linum grandiflorum]
MEYYDNYTSLYGSGGGAAADFMLPHPPSSHPPLSTAHQFGILGHFPYQSTGSWDHHHSPLGFPNYKPTGDDLLDAKALAASKNHSEAERRRRHRINTHLSNLRSLLPSTTKTDKASLLAEVIQHVKDLKRQTSHLIADDDHGLIPAEEDHLTVDADSVDDEGNLVIKASLCCQDRHDLLPDLIATLNSLRLRTLKAEITTLAGRVKHLLFFTADHPTNDYSSSSNNDINSDEEDEDKDEYQPRIQQQYSISSIHEALKAVMEKGGGGHSSSGGSVKRQRTNRNINNI